MNDIKSFLLDLWSDLQAKRLWPVAAVLLLALVAVPVVLSKPAAEPPPAPAPSAQTAPDADDKDLVALRLLEDDPAGSSLDTFGAGDPFRPPGSVARSADDSVDGAKPSLGDSTDTGGSSSSDGLGSTGDTGGFSGGTPVTPVMPDGDEGGGGTTTVEYRYVIDVTFTANGRTRRIKGMEKLDLLPSEKSPLLVFLGASSKGANAVFLVDSTLETAGEGKCKPNADECALLYLGPGSEQEFMTEEGDSYTLRIDQIRKVKVGHSADPSAKGSSSKKTAGAAVSGPRAYRRFVPPLLADLVSVSSAAGDNSTSDDDRR